MLLLLASSGQPLAASHPPPPLPPTQSPHIAKPEADLQATVWGQMRIKLHKDGVVMTDKEMISHLADACTDQVYILLLTTPFLVLTPLRSPPLPPIPLITSHNPHPAGGHGHLLLNGAALK